MKPLSTTVLSEELFWASFPLALGGQCWADRVINHQFFVSFCKFSIEGLASLFKICIYLLFALSFVGLIGNEAERVLSCFARRVIRTTAVIFTVSCGPALSSVLQIPYLISSIQ